MVHAVTIYQKLFGQQLIQILPVLHAELLNIRLKIVIFSTFTLYLNFYLNMWAKRQTVHVLGHTYLKGHTCYFEGTKVFVTLI